MYNTEFQVRKSSSRKIQQIIERLEDTKINLRLRLPAQNSKSMIQNEHLRNFKNFAFS